MEQPAPNTMIAVAAANQQALRAFANRDHPAFVAELVPFRTLFQSRQAVPGAVAFCPVPLPCIIAMAGCPAFLASYLELGGDPNLADDRGRTPAMYAIMGGATDEHEASLRMLRQHPRKLALDDHDGASEFDWAIMCSNRRLGLLVHSAGVRSNLDALKDNPLRRDIYAEVHRQRREVEAKLRETVMGLSADSR